MKKDINAWIEELKNREGVYLIDVREKDEFSEGTIPGSKNLPLSTLESNLGSLPNKDEKIYLFCHLGQRSDMARRLLKAYGYTNVTNIGGIAEYEGELEV